MGALGLVDIQYLDMKWFTTLSTEGFLQTAFHFCAGFGMQGVFNFGAEVGKTETVEQAEFRQKDQRKPLLRPDWDCRNRPGAPAVHPVKSFQQILWRAKLKQ
jgi:hypothetical protein